MFKRVRFFIISVVIINWVSFFPGFVIGQNTGSENDDNGFGISSAGLEIGFYNPGLDYWKNDSEFKDAEFSGAIHLKGCLDMRIVGDLHGQLGFGYWQETVEEELQGFGNTRLILTGLPANLDVVYYVRPFQFSIITPFLGLGGEVLFIQHQMNFEEKENPDPQWGTTFLGDATLGFQAKLSDQFAVDLDFQYKFGNYNQEFNIYDDSEEPEVIDVVTEEISLNGPKIGLTLKYLF
jgi:hypothetical protein